MWKRISHGLGPVEGKLVEQIYMEEREFETNAIRMQMDRSGNLEHSAPLYLTSSFVFEDAEDMRDSFAE